MIQDRGMSDRGKMMDGMKYSGPFLLAKCHFDCNYANVEKRAKAAELIVGLSLPGMFYWFVLKSQIYLTGNWALMGSETSCKI
jgi:hypothetical protein